MNYFNKILYITGNKKKVFILLFTIFILTTFFEALSLAILVPYLGLILNENTNESNSFFINLISELNIFENIYLGFSVFVIVVFLIKLLVSLLNIYVINSLTWKQIIYLRSKLLNSFQLMDYGTYMGKSSAEYINQIEVLSKVFIKQTFFPIIKITSDIILILAILFLLAKLNIIILLINIIFFLFFLFFYDLLFKKKIINYGYEINRENKNIFKNINELFYGFKEIKILNKLNFFVNRIMQSTETLANKQIKVKLVSDSPRFIYEFIIALLIVLFVIVYSIYLSNDLITLLPIISVFIIAFLRILPLITSINQNLIHLRGAIVANDKIFQQLKLTENKKNIIKDIKKQNNFKSIKFKEVFFGYEENKSIFMNLNFELFRNEMIGIVGKSGSGKSTFIDLLLGLIKPNSGEIYYNGELISKNNIYDSNPLQKIAFYLPQDNFIIDDNTFKNISLLEINSDDNKLKIKKILEKLELYIDPLNKLGDRGKNISGGQRQRISIARALFHNREILIMDESTSALDKLVEHEILQHLNQLKKEITIILISHDMETLKFCDKIYEISNYKISEINR